MHVMCPTFKIDVLKMEQASQTGYHEGDKVFYVFPLNWKGKEQFVDFDVDSWNAHWHSENKCFSIISSWRFGSQVSIKLYVFCVRWQA